MALLSGLSWVNVFLRHKQRCILRIKTLKTKDHELVTNDTQKNNNIPL